MKIYFKRFFSITMLFVATFGMAQAQDDIDYDQQNKAMNWYADRAEIILLRFEGIRHDSGQLPQKYYVFPYKQAGSLGFAMAVSTMDERQIVMFTPRGNDVEGKSVKRSDLPEDMYWNNIYELGLYTTHSTDITLSGRPLPVREMDKAKNTFEVVIDTEKGLTPQAYNQMIFKPHKNGVKLASQHHNFKKDNDGTVIKDEMEYTFKLNNPSIVSKMFRGYNDGEAVPWVVKGNFFSNHSLLQYSRWKEGEPIKKATADAKRIISSYYGGRRIKDTQWLATIESGERSFYAVQFEHQGTDALAAMVCIAEGEVASTWEFHGKVNSNNEGESIWFVDDEGDFMPHAPEIHCIATTPKGLELYVRVFGGESVQYYVLREVQHSWLVLQVDYWIYVWD